MSKDINSVPKLCVKLAFQIAKHRKHIKKKKSEILKIIRYPSRNHILMKHIMYSSKEVSKQSFIDHYLKRYTSDKWYKWFKGQLLEADKKVLHLCSSIRQFYFNKNCYIGFIENSDSYFSLNLNTDKPLMEKFDIKYLDVHVHPSYISKDVFNNFRKDLCAKKIQRVVRIWFGQPFYKSGNKGLIFRKADTNWNDCITECFK